MVTKLIKDEFVNHEEIQGTTTKKDIVEHYIKHAFYITFDGVLFIDNLPDKFKGKPYHYKDHVEREKKKAENIERWPKKYWYIIAIGTFVIGSFSDIVKEVVKEKILPDKTILIPPLPSHLVTLRTSSCRKSAPLLSLFKVKRQS